jgi:hypothetical protein
VSTRETHEGYVRRTIGPVLGEVKIRKLGADSLDSLYTALKKCSRLCRRLPRTEHYADGEHACDARCGPLHDHRTTRPHECDSRCRPHVCKPMKPATILRIHSIISSALDLAVRYDWADRNVAKNASPPHRRPGPRRRVRVLPGPDRPRAMESRHDDPPVPPVRPRRQGRSRKAAAELQRRGHAQPDSEPHPSRKTNRS